MTKRGRPQIKKAQRKGFLIPIRVNADENKAIDAAADAAGVDRSKWARAALLAAARGAKISEGEGIEPTAD